MFSKEAGIHGGKRARSGRKKVGKALRVVRAFRLSQAVYEKYCQLRGSGHFAGDEDFFTDLLAVEENACRNTQRSVSRLLPDPDQSLPAAVIELEPSTPAAVATDRPGSVLSFSPVDRPAEDFVASTPHSSRVNPQKCRLFQNKCSPVGRSAVSQSVQLQLSSTFEVDVSGANCLSGSDSDGDDQGQLRDAALCELLPTSDKSDCDNDASDDQLDELMASIADDEFER